MEREMEKIDGVWVVKDRPAPAPTQKPSKKPDVDRPMTGGEMLLAILFIAGIFSVCGIVALWVLFM